MTTPVDEVIWELPAETKEWVGPLHFFIDGIEQVSGVKYTLVLLGARPGSTFADPFDINGKNGIMVGAGTAFPLTAGETYRIWGQCTSNPEIPVINNIGTVTAV